MPRLNDLAACQEEARRIVTDPELGEAIDRARGLALAGATTIEAARACGTSGFVVHTLAFASFCFLRYGHDPMLALTEAVSAGGDSDSIGAILGGWLGALHGEAGLPGDLIRRIHDGPFGPAHLRALAACLGGSVRGDRARCPATRPWRRSPGTWPSTRSSSATGSGGWCRSDPRARGGCPSLPRR